LRGVDEMESAVGEAGRRAKERVMILGVRSADYPSLARDFGMEERVGLPGSREGVLLVARRLRGG